MAQLRVDQQGNFGHTPLTEYQSYGQAACCEIMLACINDRPSVPFGSLEG
jgi:hypothetical protein